MPKANAPNAPWVLVWLSPQTMVMPGLVRPSSGPMTCTMPCLRRLDIVKLNAELGAVGAQGIDLLGGDRIFDDEPVGRGGNIMVHRGHCPVGAAYGSSRQAKPFECLRRGDLMQQMQIDIEQCRLAFGRGDNMRFPYLFEERFCGLRHRGFSLCVYVGPEAIAGSGGLSGRAGLVVPPLQIP